MNPLQWLKNLFSARIKSLAIYRRGMKRAGKHDFAGAIADYTCVLEMPGVPQDVAAMALYNRALAHSSAGNQVQAVVDLDAVLALPKSPPNIKTAAQEKLVRWKRRSGASEHARE